MKFKKILKSTLICIIALGVLGENVFAEGAEAIFKKLVIIYDMETETVQDSDGNVKKYYPIYVYGAVDGLDYDEVGFDIKTSHGEYSDSVSSYENEVCESVIVENSNGEKTIYKAENLGGKYMFGSKLLFNTENWSNKLTEITFQPFVKKNAKKLSGDVITINDAIIKETDESSGLFREEKKIEKVFENTDKYIYRVGNSNPIKLGSLFKNVEEKSADSAKVQLSVTLISGNAEYNYSKNISDWTASEISFSGGGAVKLEISDGILATELYLEVVDGYNVCEYSDLKPNGNNVLLSDIKMPDGEKYSLANGTLYGNGFTFDISNGTHAKNVQGVLVLNNAGLDNVSVTGKVYTEYASSSSEEYYPSAVQSFGTSRITNSRISNCRSALRMQSGKLTVENTVLFGGRYANLDIWGGTTNLSDVVTVNMPYSDSSTNGSEVLGLGILMENVAAELNISGSLKQYNWIKQADQSALPNDSSVKNMFDELFSSEAYSPIRYKYNGTDYVNTGILSLSADNSVSGLPNSYTQIIINNSYFVCSPNTSSAQTIFADGVPMYNENDRSIKQGTYLPTVIRNYPSDIYNSASGKIAVTFNEGESYIFDPNFITVSKFGYNLPVSVLINDSDYTGSTINLSESGTYTIKYKWTDPYNYTFDATSLNSVEYSEELVLEVTAVAPEAKHAMFKYSDGSAGITKDIGGKIHVMPNVAATSDTVASTLIDGETVYMPIVEVQYKNNIIKRDYNGYAPIFTALNITDYIDGGTGDEVTYDVNTTEMPENLKVFSGNPYINGAASTTGSPVKYSYKKYPWSSETNYGLCWESLKGSAIDESNHDVCYVYTDNAGQMYFYYIRYHFSSHKL